MTRRRPQLTPWRTAGERAEGPQSADEVVRETGWVFNNETGSALTLAQFVQQGDKEVDVYMRRFQLLQMAGNATLLEIGSGIGRMTAGFTKNFVSVIATDVDAAFLERCRDTVAEFGDVMHLRTVHIADGRTIPVADQSVDVVFSYITLQHCKNEDALALTREALRIVKPGGRIVLNYRTWVAADIFLVPAGALMRATWRVPFLRARLAKWRWSTRLGWQANRLSPAAVIAAAQDTGVPLSDVLLRHHKSRSVPAVTYNGIAVEQRKLDKANKSHWWLVATRS
jgi:SAM-dependent methyltransferase